MLDLHGAPMIQRQLERIKRASLIDTIVVATSIDPSDDALADFVSSLGFEVERGPLDDVLARYVQVIDRMSPDVVVRLTADCPLTSPAVIDSVIDGFQSGNFDYFSNTLQPQFPDGLDAEVVRSSALTWVNSNSIDAHEHEHVTLGVYRRLDQFRVGNLTSDLDQSTLRWTVDNLDDLTFVRSIYSMLFDENPEFEYEDVLALLARQPDLTRTTMDAARNAALQGLDTGAMNA
jgi:spore coat polysaccharide biosynthesis protein SpsF